MFEPLTVRSHRGPYAVRFDESPAFDPAPFLDGEPHFVVDAVVARLHAGDLRPILGHPRTVVIEATEENKSLEKTIPVLERLVRDRVRRNHALVAVGGGVIQDVVCFAASVLLRGVPWRFVPTTLLAQADSCIGSKSSINLGGTKNILGTFNPPQDILVHAGFLRTLDPQDMRSGIGEILKVHAIDGARSFDRLAADFDRLLEDRPTLLRYVREALLIKRRFIEEDEFDRGVRNIFNYGHSFGHAIESATSYAVPHGIAVTMGMDMANEIAFKRGLTPRDTVARMRPVLRKNYAEYAATAVPVEPFLSALGKDKKNTGAALGLILPVGESAEIRRVEVPADAGFRAQCEEFLAGMSA